ncbi:MAG: cytochrome c [Pseudomonadota bacterium]
MRRHTLMLLLTAVLSLAAATTQASAEVSTERQRELLHLLRHDCGSCHGMTLKGGLGPTLLPQALAGKPAETLEATVLYGRAGTPMPPWRGLLTEEEVAWLVALLMKGVPDAP